MGGGAVNPEAAFVGTGARDRVDGGVRRPEGGAKTGGGPDAAGYAEADAGDGKRVTGDAAGVPVEELSRHRARVSRTIWRTAKRHRMPQAVADARPRSAVRMGEGWAMPFAGKESLWYDPGFAVSMLQGFSSTLHPFFAQEKGRTILPGQMATHLAKEEGFVWLDSAIPGAGAVSILTSKPERMLRGNLNTDWDAVEEALREGAQQKRAGGLFGWVGFDGEFILGDYPHALLYDHEAGKWFETGGRENWPFSKAEAEGEWHPLIFRPLIEKDTFERQVRQAQEYIAAGDIYQVNLSYPWEAAWSGGSSLLPWYERLREVSPAPHAAYLHLGETQILSASPELFLKMEGRTITTHPIKGTRPRFPDDAVRDARAAEELLASEKEKAELLMITDLERNDLGQICEYGSVQTPDLWRVERFAQVYHLVSTVTGQLRAEVSHAEAFRACFPGGSISGAPKKRALEIIAELEPHPRGVYTGAMGYFGYSGDSQWNIAIRSAVLEGERMRFHVGAGIVADSVPSLEWEETLHKAAGLLKAWTSSF